MEPFPHIRERVCFIYGFLRARGKLRKASINVLRTDLRDTGQSGAERRYGRGKDRPHVFMESGLNFVYETSQIRIGISQREAS